MFIAFSEVGQNSTNGGRSTRKKSKTAVQTSAKVFNRKGKKGNIIFGMKLTLITVCHSGVMNTNQRVFRLHCSKIVLEGYALYI